MPLPKGFIFPPEMTVKFQTVNEIVIDLQDRITKLLDAAKDESKSFDQMRIAAKQAQVLIEFHAYLIDKIKHD